MQAFRQVAAKGGFPSGSEGHPLAESGRKLPDDRIPAMLWQLIAATSMNFGYHLNVIDARSSYY